MDCQEGPTAYIYESSSMLGLSCQVYAQIRNDFYLQWGKILPLLFYNLKIEQLGTLKIFTLFTCFWGCEPIDKHLSVRSKGSGLNVKLQFRGFISQAYTEESTVVN